MLYFQNDYIQGAHPKILDALVKTNDQALTGYGEDFYTQSASQKIKAAIQKPEAAVYFLSGGTQTNKIVITTVLDSFQGVIAADTGHIASHEAGAIEASGHKILTLPNHQGKIKVHDLIDFMETFIADQNKDHRVYPGMVYISHPTEYGTLYTKEELTEISTICRQYRLPLFLDGARLIYALADGQSDLDLATIADLCDIFYLGGTKAGTLIGEALIFYKDFLPSHFVTRIKQFGALLAKSRILSVQFDALFTDNLYLEIANHTHQMTLELIDVLKEKGYEFYLQSPTNQQFMIVTPDLYEKISHVVQSSFWETLRDGRIVIRLVTSWSTTHADIEALRQLLPSLTKE